MLRIITLVLLGLASSIATAETLYRWVDDRGNVQFGQNPPANRPFAEVNVRAAQPPGGQLRERAPQPVEPAASAPAPVQAEPPQPSPAERAARCEQARTEARTLADNPRLARTLPDGSRERIGEDERQQLMRQTDADIARYCN